MKSRNIINISAIILALFGLLTLILSSSIIFDWFDLRSKEGNYVMFIVWANFIASILYLIAVYGFIKREKWTFRILLLSLFILVVAFIALQFHINNGGLYETKTLFAMIFRILVTFVFSLVAYFKLKNTKSKV